VLVHVQQKSDAGAGGEKRQQGARWSRRNLIFGVDALNRAVRPAENSPAGSEEIVFALEQPVAESGFGVGTTKSSEGDLPVMPTKGEGCKSSRSFRWTTR
jgi:hypothetical protein